MSKPSPTEEIYKQLKLLKGMNYHTGVITTLQEIIEALESMKKDIIQDYYKRYGEKYNETD